MRLLFHLGLLFLTFSAYSQNIRTLNGYISSKKTGEKLIGATIYDTVHKVGTTTNEYGFYSLSIPNEATVLRITNFGFDPYFLDATLQKNEYNIIVSEINELNEVIVTATSGSRRSVESTNIGTMELSM